MRKLNLKLLASLICLASIVSLFFQNCGNINLLEPNNTLAPTDNTPPLEVTPVTQQKTCANCEVVDVPTFPGQRPEDIGTMNGFFSNYFMNNPEQLPDNMANYMQLYMARDKVTTYKLPKKSLRGAAVALTLYNANSAILIMISAKPQDPLQLIQSFPASLMATNREDAIDAEKCIFFGYGAYNSYLNSRYCNNYEKVLTENPNDNYFYLNVRPVYPTANTEEYFMQPAANAPAEQRCEAVHSKSGEKVCIIGLVW